MATMMDMALEDIIKNNQKYPSRRGRGRGGRGGSRGGADGNKGSGGAFRRIRMDLKRTAQPYRKARTQESNFDDDTVWEHDLYQEEEEEEEQQFVEEQGPVRAIQTGTKVAIDNLEYSVSEDNLKEIFEAVGQLKNVTIHYDKSGRSEGTGEITFVRREDAQTAIRKYNRVEVDGKAIRLSNLGSNLQIPAQRTRGRGNRNQSRGGGGGGGGGRSGGIVIHSGRTGGARRVRVGGNRGRGRGRRYN